MDNDEFLDVIRKHAIALREHFDSVQIVCTRHLNDEEGEINWSLGRGSWAARVGATRAWLLREDEAERHRSRGGVDDDTRPSL